VLTTVNRRVMPLIRYRTGDVARWLPEPCPCGLPLRRLSPLGIRAREVHELMWKARRFGLVELARTAHGGRAYFWTGLVRPPASAAEPAAARN